jgi:glutaminyl-tRNA synthetase
MSNSSVPESSDTESAVPDVPRDFIRDIVRDDLASGRCQTVVTRFPPEPNGYLHIGHAKSICLNFGIAKENQGRCNLRMDDTNPTKEEVEYIHAILKDVRWLISGWADSVLTLSPTPHSDPTLREDTTNLSRRPFYASDYFPQLYDYAVELIQKGHAYVCDLSAADTERFRGSTDRPGEDSPFRSRSVDENLELFARMKAGNFPDGARTLRARIDMASPNIWMRDPVLYRIRHTEHHQTGEQWCIYPMYDFAHCLSDAIEGITHSICTLEFEVHRPLYDWILNQLDLSRPLPKQYECARLNLGYTVMSKRKLLQLVNERIVSGWDDPRMPTLAGLRRRGVTAKALRDFAYPIGVTKYNALTDVAVLEKAIRDDLNQHSLRRLAVVNPIKLILTNLTSEDRYECQATNNPEDPASGTRSIYLTRELWIEQEDFQEVPPPKFFRLRPGGEVRLKYGCIIRCDSVVKDDQGNVIEIHATADLDSRSGGPNSGRKMKGTIHWVSAQDAVQVEVRLYDRLFTEEEPEAEGRDLKTALNPHSLITRTAWVEPALASAAPDGRYQFERLGYFTLDPDSLPDRLIFNRTITLRDNWAKKQT